MQLKLFVISVKNIAAAEAEMNAFLRSHRMLSVKKEFVPDGENSYWTFCVEYLETPLPGSIHATGGNKPPKVDYKEVLSEEEFALFSQLREHRKQVADREAIPVYAVFTNEQLAQIVQKKITSKAGLKEVEGVGDGRIEKYGEELLRRINGGMAK